MDLAATGRYLAVPLRPAPLLLIVIFSFLLSLAARVGLFGLPLALILLSWFFKYAFVLLDHVVSGAAEPPVLSVEMVNPLDEQRPLVMLILAVLLFYISDAAGYWVGPYLAVLMAAVSAAVLPAVIAVQGATGSVAQSLNPRTVSGLILRLRGDYVLILVCILALWGLERAVLYSTFGNALPLALRIALLMYGWLAIFALIGGVLFERRDDIGLDDASAVQALERAEDAELERVRKRQLDRIYAEWRGGAHANAWQTISTQISQSADPAAELGWLYEHIARWPDARLAERLAQQRLPQLLAQGAAGAALDLVRERLKANARFRPASSAELLKVVHLARDAGDRPTARLLLQDFKHLYPDDPAQTLIDKLSEQLAR